jgi:hypothetical protein
MNDSIGYQRPRDVRPSVFDPGGLTSGFSLVVVLQ